MSEHQTIDHRKWNGASSDELGYTGDSLHTSLLHRHTNQSGQQFNVLNIDARRDGVGSTILASTPLDHRITPFFTLRAAIFARQMGVQFIVSEVPGVTIDPENPLRTKGAFQTPNQALSAFMGNYEPIAKAQLQAIDAEVGLEDGQEVELFGESLGTDYVVGMAQAIAHHSFEKRLKISKMHLFEPVNSFGNYRVDRIIGILRKLTTIEAKRAPLYIAENEAIGHRNAKPFEQESEENEKIDKLLKTRQFLAAYFAGAGIRKGLHGAILDAMRDHSADGSGLHEAEIITSLAVHSSVSHEKDSSQLTDAINEAGGRAKLVLLEAGEGDQTPLGHGVLNSIGRLAEFAIGHARMV
jgi:hypothetical protein